jgi:hypothetical protein
MIKVLALSLVLVFVGLSCAIPLAVAPREVSFEWFNLSANQIWVTDAVGLPDQSWPGRLMPSHGENMLESSQSVFAEVIRISDRIVIKWKDNGTLGFSGYARSGSPGDNPPGIAHEATFKRDELGLPARTGNARIRFTYLGNDKWRIAIVK